MIHFDFELLKTRPKGKLADAEDGGIKITHTLQCDLRKQRIMLGAGEPLPRPP